LSFFFSVKEEKLKIGDAGEKMQKLKRKNWCDMKHHKS